MKNKIAFACCSRADYGIVRNYLKLLNADKSIDLEILVTGALLKKKYNYEVNMIKSDGFKIGFEAYLPIKTTNNKNIIHAMSIALDKFGSFFSKKHYSLLIILGDRYEMLPIAIAAAIQKLPILHLHGGEATYANYDEFIRHSITKMSTFHFVSTEEYRKRVIQMGENPKTVFNVGSLGAENCKNINMTNVSNEIIKLPKKKYYVILFHPETFSLDSIENQTTQLLNAIMKFNEYKFIFIGSNADTGSDYIRKRIKSFTKKETNTVYYENLHPDSYHYLLKNSLALIGNSSSGIIEAPYLNTFTINIGNRQAGRVRDSSVIDVKCDTEEIVKSIKYTQINRPKVGKKYLKKDSAAICYRRTVNIVKNIKSLTKYPKEFYDIERG